MKKYYFLSSLLILALFACKENEAPAAPAPLVEAVKTLKKDVAWNVLYPASVAGSKDVDVRAQAGGILKEKFFNEGDFVQEGAQLFQIDPAQYEIDLNKAKGALAQADSDLKKAKRDYQRMQTLFKENAVSRKDHDDALSAYERAQANYQVAKSGVDNAQVMLGYTKVVAPISGITRNDKYSEGNLISVAGESSFLVNIIQINPLEIRFSIPSAQWNAMRANVVAGKIGQDQAIDVQVITSDGSEYPELGKVKFVDSSEDAATGTISVKADVPNPGNKRILMPGQFVKVELQGMYYKDAVIIPQSAILNTAKGNMVYVVDANSTAVLRPVTTAAYKDYAIVDGISEGEVVITSGVIKVKPNQAVNAEIKEFGAEL